MIAKTQFFYFLFILCLLNTKLLADTIDDKSKIKDSVYIDFIEERLEPDKVLHAEPLYIDLIRDLGARKGEKEWNFGFGLQDNDRFDTYEALVEYEWAPIDRLGLEIEIPVLIYSPHFGKPADSLPSDRVESLKLAAQWSIFVDQDIATSMAVGYINEFEFSDLNDFGNPLFIGNLYNPFFIIAKRWGNNFHSLIYTGPRIHQDFASRSFSTSYEMHTSFHYMISGTRNFIGVEINKYFSQEHTNITLRPQMRLGISDNFLIGIVAGIPVSRENERLSTFLRLIWEPGH